ncbi:MAG: YciI family protein [Micromonosporaceae bacterium]
MTIDPDSIRFDRYEMVLLRRTVRSREFDEEKEERIFREHAVHTIKQVESGVQLAAGPVQDAPDEEQPICGFGLFRRGSLDEVRKLMDADPGVQQGQYTYDVMTWLTRKGNMEFPGASPGGLGGEGD